MEPRPRNAQEVEGVPNPGAVRSPRGELCMFPRLVLRVVCSRMAIARARFNEEADPGGAERPGIALAAEADNRRESMRIPPRFDVRRGKAEV